MSETIFHDLGPGDRIHCGERAIDYSGPGGPAVELTVGDLRLRCTLGQLAAIRDACDRCLAFGSSGELRVASGEQEEEKDGPH